MRIAVIGAGNWGINLVRNLSELSVLSHVVEKNSELTNQIEKDFPEAQCLENYDSLINDEIDAVAIATPAQSHFDIASKFLETGKDVFIEKPMTLSSKEAEGLVSIAEENDSILMVGHMLMYQPAITFIKSYLDEGHIGKIYHIHQERLKLGRVRTAENVVWSLGVHDIAVLLYLVGAAPNKVNFSGHCGVQEDIEDDAYVHMSFEQGTIAHLHSSWIWPTDSRCMRIIGSKGMLVYDEHKQSVTLHKKGIGQDLENLDQGEEVIFEGSSQPLRLEMEHLIDCIKSRKRPISDGNNGLEVIRVLEALK
ncbi:Gfo/Idh/MocA family oxidoreductase [Verrucomicrobia bacterium]|nr:Gfo/Idh/MocA family oxidoreductase [Verrucomicrobiota bacterium]